MAEPAGKRSFTVVLALAANVAVGLLKLAAGLLTGSVALLSEAAHSAGDCTTEVLLLVAVRRSQRPADRSHPFGYGKERYFWSLLAAFAIFVSGSIFSVYEGVRALQGGGGGGSDLWINYPVLALAFVFEGLSLRQAMSQLGRQRRRRRKSLPEVIRQPEDPTVNSVALEDSAALTGIVVAAAGVALRQVTGSAEWDGMASIVIGVILLFVAFVLARACESLLIGQQADPALLRAVVSHLEEQAEIVDVVDMLSMLTGTGRVMLGARVDFVDDLTAGELEAACSRLDQQLRADFAELDEIFIQPISRSDPRIKQRVRGRYGRLLADG